MATLHVVPVHPAEGRELQILDRLSGARACGPANEFGLVVTVHRTGCRAAVGSGLVVLTRFVRVAPSMPAARVNRPVWSPPMSRPARRAAFHSFRTL